MAKYSSKDTVFLIDGYNVLGVTTQVDHAVEALTEETTPFGAEWETHEYIGLKRTEFSQQGFFDDAASSVNDALSGKQGESRIVCFGIEGNTIGRKFTGFRGVMHSKYTRIGSRENLHRANADYLGNGVTEDGRIIHALTARTADGDTEATPVDNAAATAAGGSAYLQVSALTLDGYTDLTVVVRESADGIAWNDLTTFTAVALAPGKERKAIVGNIKRYLAVSYEFTGIGTSPTATFFVGVVRD